MGLAASLPKNVTEVRVHRRPPQRLSPGNHVPSPASHAQWLQELAKKRAGLLCYAALQVMGVRSAQDRSFSTRKSEDGHLKLLIGDIYDENKKRYGAPRIQADLTAQGRRHSVRRIARLMRDLGLYGKTRRKFIKTTDSNHILPVVPNLLERDFSPETPNTVWAGDITQ